MIEATRSAQLNSRGLVEPAAGNSGGVSWIRACEAADVAEGEAVVVERAPAAPIAVFNVAGEFFAVDDTCTHEEYSLADGYIDGDIVECPLHMAKYDIRTGKMLCRPANADLCSYPVKVEGGVVYVEVEHTP